MLGVFLSLYHRCPTLVPITRMGSYTASVLEKVDSKPALPSRKVVVLEFSWTDRRHLSRNVTCLPANRDMGPDCARRPEHLRSLYTLKSNCDAIFDRGSGYRFKEVDQLSRT